MTFTPLILVTLLAVSSAANVNRDEYGSADKSVDHSASSVSSSSSSNQYTPGTGGSNQGNLYYYYYPIQDKGKEQSYHAAPSNNYPSAVIPSGQGQSGNDDSLKPQSSNGNGQDLSYSSPEMTAYEHHTGDYGSNSAASFNGQSQPTNFGNGNGGSGPNFGGNGGYGEQGRPSFGGSGSPSNLIPNYQPDEAAAAAFSPLSGQFEGSDYSSAVASQLGQHGATYQPYGKNPAYANYPQPSNQQSTYETTSSGYRRYGISSIIMPMLALAGLSLLFPTTTASLLSTAAGRKRRSTDSKDSAVISYIDRIERYTSLCKAALEQEECMNRIICELGDAMSTVRGKKTLFAVVDHVAPTWMGKKVGALKAGALSNDLTKCKKYTCQRKK